MKDLLRLEIAFLKPYESHVIPGNIKMDANENPFPWPQGMQEELLTQDFAFTRYPDGQAQQLRQSIAAFNGVKVEEVLVGNGSDELIQVILHTFGGQGKALMIHPPTFGMYAAAAAITSTELVEVPLLGGIQLDVQNMLRYLQVNDKLDTDGIAGDKLSDDQFVRGDFSDNCLACQVSVVIICNPNNPTGTLFPREEILQIVQNTKALVVIDEAYAEFAGETMIDLIHDYPNLLIMRTFSKAFGMAALRLGYVMGNQELIGYLNRVRQPFNVNSFSQQAGITALKYAAAYQKQIEVIINQMQILYNEISQIEGIKVLPTYANFLLFQPTDPDNWADRLSEKGFTVRKLGDIPGLGKSLRMSAGTPEENQAFIKALKEIAVEVAKEK